MLKATAGGGGKGMREVWNKEEFSKAWESATKEAGVDILIGEETEKYCGYTLQSLKPIKVKGKEKPLKIYTV